MNKKQKFGFVPQTLKQQRVITSTGFVDIPANITQVFAIVIGGGGAGGSGDGNDNGTTGGSGGGGAGVSYGWTPVSKYATIGAGGVASNANPGGNGGTSYYGVLYANGGGGGARAYGNNPIPPVGGAAGGSWNDTNTFATYTPPTQNGLFYVSGTSDYWATGSVTGVPVYMYSGKALSTGGGAAMYDDFPLGYEITAGSGGEGVICAGGGGAALAIAAGVSYLWAGFGGNSSTFIGGAGTSDPARTLQYTSGGGGAGFLGSGASASGRLGGNGGLGGGGGGASGNRGSGNTTKGGDGGQGAVILYW
jgi:hypothetical protein